MGSPEDSASKLESKRARALQPWPTVAAILLAVVLSNAYAVSFVNREHTLFAADHVAYWSFAADLSHQLATDPLSAVSAIARSVATSELNLLPATPIALVMLIFGTSRLVYVLAILDLYAIPALVLLGLLAHRLAREHEAPSASLTLWATASTVLLVPVFWWPISLGYLGVGGMALGLLALLLYLSPPGGRRTTLHLVAVGVLLVLVFLFRRWYAFWAVAFGVMVVADAAGSLWSQWSRGDLRPWKALRAPLVIGATAIATSLLLAAGTVSRVLRTDYGDLFADFKIRPTLAAELSAWVQHFGVVVIGVLVLAVVVLARTRRSRRVVVLLGIQMVTTFALMRRVQDPSPQHWYLYMAVVLVLISLLLVRVVNALPGRSSRAAVMIAVALVGALSTGWALWAPSGACTPLFAAPRFEPQVRDDLMEVRRLLGFLDRQIASAPGYVYVIGSTPLLSDTSFAYANLSLGSSYSSPAALLQAVHLDRRDGFPTNLLRCRYVVVSMPVQCTRPEIQRTVEIPALQILDQRGIGVAFGRFPEVFELAGGVQAFVYRRVQPFTGDEVQALVDELRSAYPDRPEIYLPAGAAGR